MAARHWIRFAGVLWEDDTFEPEPGWETDTIAHRPPDGDGRWTLTLRDEFGHGLAHATPEVTFHGPRGGREMRRARVAAYVPWVDTGRALELARDGHVVVARAISPLRPKITITECQVDGRDVKLRWDALHPDPEAAPLTFRVVYAAPGRGAFQVADGLTAPWLTHRIDVLPGHPKGRFAVLATDGYRSAVDVSEPVHVPPGPARVAVIEPPDGSVWPAGQPLTLRGVAHDDAGRRLPAEGMIWTIDGEPVGEDEVLLLVPDLAPGEHTIVLAWEGPGAPRATARSRITTLPRPARPHQDDPEPDPPTGVLRIKL